MIDALINILDAAAEVVPVAQRNGLAELKPNPTGGTMPMVHVGAGEFRPVGNDMNGSWSYWRLLNDGITSEAADVMEGCAGLRYTMRLRLVMYVDREGPCEDVTKALTTVSNSVRANTKTMRTALRAVNVSVQSATLVTGGVYDSEFGKTGANIPTGKQLVAIDFALVVLGTEACILTCGDSIDLTCAIIDKASNAKVEGCLGDERIAEICGGTGPCPPTTVNGTESDTETITVLQGGVEVGTLNPATGVHTIPACDPLTVTLGGVEIVDEADPCGAAVVLECTDLVDAVVVEGAGTASANGLYVADGTYNGRRQWMNANGVHVFAGNAEPDPPAWLIGVIAASVLYVNDDINAVDPWDSTWSNDEGDTPAPTVRQATIADICGGSCSDGSAVLKDTSGNTISTTPVPAGTTVDITAPDATVKTTDGVTTVQAIRSNANGNLPQSVIKYTDAANAPQVTAASDTEFATTLRSATVVPRRQILNSAGNAANATWADLDDLISNTMPVAGDATAVVKNLNGTTLVSEAVPANASENITAPIPLKFALAAGDDTSITWTVTDDEAGTYDTYTQDGASGTLTYSLNGGAFASLTGTIVLAVSDTIAVKRTTFSAAGFIKWAP